MQRLLSRKPRSQRVAGSLACVASRRPVGVAAVDGRRLKNSMNEPNHSNDDKHRAPLLSREHSFASVTDKIASIVLARQLKRGWVVGFLLSFLLTMLLLVSVTWLFIRGVGIWGINVPIGW